MPVSAAAGRGECVVVVGLDRAQVEDHARRPRSGRRRRASPRRSAREQRVRRAARHARSATRAASRPAASRRRPSASVVDDRRAATRAARRSRSARSEALAAGRRDLPPDRDSRVARRRRGRARGSPRPPRAAPCPGASRGPAGPCAAGRQVGAADDEPGLGPADELVAAERHEVGAVGEPLARASARARARTRPCRAARRCRGRRRRARRARWAAAASAAGIGRLDEAGLAEVRRVDAEDEPGAAVGERRLEVGDARAVRRPDLDQLRARRAGRSPGSGRRRRSRRARRARPRPRPAASPTASASAAALLFVTSASSAPVSAMRCSSAVRNAARRGGRSRGRARGGGASRPARRWTRPTPLGGHGARPRFVWTINGSARIQARSTSARPPLRTSSAGCAHPAQRHPNS